MCVAHNLNIHFMSRMHSISSKNPSLKTPFTTSTTPYLSLISFSSGHDINICFRVCTSLLHLHNLSSRFEFGICLSFSTRRLCDPVRYLVIKTRWNSKTFSYAGFDNVGLTVMYVPSLESSSNIAASSIFFSKGVTKCRS